MDAKTRDDLLGLFQSKLNEAMRFYLETCTRCGICTEACHVYASMGQVRYIAAYRHEIIRRLYKKYFKARGKIWPSVGEAKELTEMALEELFDAAYSCTGCRRCMVYCPFGIDTQMLMSIAKLLLIGAHTEPETLTMLADMSIEKGKSIELFKEGFIDGTQTPGRRSRLQVAGGSGRSRYPGGRGRGRPALCGPGRRPFHHPGRGRLQRRRGKMDPEFL